MENCRKCPSYYDADTDMECVKRCDEIQPKRYFPHSHDPTQPVPEWCPRKQGCGTCERETGGYNVNS